MRTKRTGRVVAAGLAAVLAACAPAGAQQPEPLVFPAGVEVAAIDVAVVDENGRPVPDLRPSDFALTVGGQPRTVVSAEFVRQTGEEPAEEALAPAHFSTNERLIPGRLVLISVDVGNIEAGGGRDLVRAAGRLLDRLGPADRVGLLTIPDAEPREEFTADKERVRAALEQVAGRARRQSRRLSISEALAYVEDDDEERWQAATSRECSTGAFACVRDLEGEAQWLAHEFRFQADRSLAVLESAFETLERIEARKVVVVISQGLALPDAGSRAGRTTPALRRLATTAAQARLSLYLVNVPNPVGLGADSNLPPGIVEDDRFLLEQGLESLATIARGTVLRGDPDRAFERLAREVSGYYLLGYEPGEGERDGKPREMHIVVARPGVSVRTGLAPPLSSTTDAKAQERALVTSLQAPVTASAIPVRVATYALRDADPGRVRVLVSAEIGRTTTPRGLMVGYVLLDNRGKVAASGVQRAAADADGEGAVPFTATLSVPPGLYTLRIAARDRMGRQGATDHPVKAALVTADDLAFSDLMLGQPPSKGAGLRPGLGLEVHGGTLLAHIELYGKTGSSATVTVDVAREESGAPLLRVPARVAASGARHVAQALLPLDSLPPGDYLARAVLFVNGRQQGTALHPLRVLAP